MDPTLQAGQNVTTWSLEKKNVILDGLGDFLGTELKPAVQFQGGFPLSPWKYTGMLPLVKLCRSPVMDGDLSSRE